MKAKSKLLLFSGLLFFAACESAAYEAGGTLSFAEDSVVLVPCDVKQLTLRLNSEDADMTETAFTSSAPDVVRVEADGGVSGEKLGTAIITAENGGLHAQCTVTVKPGCVVNLDTSPNDYDYNIETFLDNVTESEYIVRVKGSYSKNNHPILSGDGKWQDGNVEKLIKTIRDKKHIKITLDISAASFEFLRDRGIDFKGNDCTNLVSLILPDFDFTTYRITTYFEVDLHNCTSLESIWLPKGIKPCLNGCTSLKSVDMLYTAGSITSGNGGFEQCKSLKSITFRATKSEWYSPACPAEAISWINYVDHELVIHCIDGDITWAEEKKRNDDYVKRQEERQREMAQQADSRT